MSSYKGWFASIANKYKVVFFQIHLIKNYCVDIILELKDFFYLLSLFPSFLSLLLNLAFSILFLFTYSIFTFVPLFFLFLSFLNCSTFLSHSFSFSLFFMLYFNSLFFSILSPFFLVPFIFMFIFLSSFYWFFSNIFYRILFSTYHRRLLFFLSEW